MKDLFQDLPAEERKEALGDQATKVEMLPVKRPYTPEELAYFKDQVSDKMINVSDLEVELDKIKTDYKSKMEPEKKEVKQLLRQIRLKYEENEETVYLLADYAEGTMNYYNQSGGFIESRKLMPHEKQTTILSMKSGTND